METGATVGCLTLAALSLYSVNRIPHRFSFIPPPVICERGFPSSSESPPDVSRSFPYPRLSLDFATRRPTSHLDSL